MRLRLLAVAAATLAAACGSGRLVRHQQVNEDALAVVRRLLPEIRGLRFTAPVPALVQDPAGIAALLAQEIDEDYPPGDLARMDAVYTRLGLLPPGSALRPAFLRLYDQEAAGFYDPRRKRLVLATTALHAAGFWMDVMTTLTGRDLVGEFLVSHELTHALQDQHWGLPTTPELLLDGHGDARLARHALLEGDATLAAFAYVRGSDLDAATIDWIEGQLHDVPRQLAQRYPDVPELVRVSVAFQYDAGTTFAGWALGAGGWPAVDAAEADPPASTEQVLHPARYFGVRDRPRPVTVGGTRALERAGWRRVLEDTVGELQLRVLARRFLPPAQADAVADGWGGDRLRALERGGDLVLVWMTAWDSPADAAEFAAAVPTMLPDARCERRDDRVLALLAPAGTVDIDGLARRAWAVPARAQRARR